MVTITHSNIDPRYMKIEDWIKHGIATDAIFLLGNRWSENYRFSFFSMFKIRNKDHIDLSPIKPLNKW